MRSKPNHIVYSEIFLSVLWGAVLAHLVAWFLFPLLGLSYPFGG